MPDVILTISQLTAPGSGRWHVYLDPGNGQQLELKASTESLEHTLTEARLYGYAVQLTTRAHKEMVDAGVAPRELPSDVLLIDGWPIED
jgi:hypothetical protein